MPRRFSFSFSIAGLLILILLGIISASAAMNIVPVTGASCSTRSIRANDLKPDECASLNLINIVTTDIGTNGNSLILGDVTTETLQGLGGDDCILGGAGDDTLDGGDGYDVCIGGSGNNTFTDCEKVSSQ